MIDISRNDNLGLAATKQFFKNISVDSSIMEIRSEQYPPSQTPLGTFAGDMNKQFDFLVHIPQNYVLWTDKSYFQVALKIRKTDATTAIGLTDKVNIGSVFGFFKSCDLYVNSILCSRMNDVPRIRRAWSYITHSRSSLENNDFYMHFDIPQRSAGIDATSFINENTGKFVLSGGTETIDGSITDITFTSAGGSAGAWTGGTSTKTLIFSAYGTNDSGKYLGNVTGAQRKLYCSDPTVGNTLFTYTFNIPVSYFSGLLEAAPFLWGGRTIKFSLRSIAEASEYLFDNQTVTEGFCLSSVYLVNTYVRFNDIVMSNFNDLISSSKMIIPYLSFEHSVNSCSAVTSINVNSSQNNLIYFLNYFNKTSSIDKFQYMAPTDYSATSANNTEIRNISKYDGKQIRTAQDQIIADLTKYDATVAYNDYKLACSIFNRTNQSKLAISQHELPFARPLYVTRIGGFDGLGNNVDNREKRLDENFTFSKATTANTQLHSIYVSQSFLVMDKDTFQPINVK